MKTLIALTTALRNLWLLSQGIMLLIVLDPGLGVYEAASELAGGPEVLLRGALVLVLVGLLWEHFLGILTRKRQSALARALLRLQPGLQHVGAIRILIHSLATGDPKMVESVHQELVKLTGKDLGPDPHPWQQWLDLQEKISAGKMEPNATESPETPIEEEPSR